MKKLLVLGMLSLFCVNNVSAMNQFGPSGEVLICNGTQLDTFSTEGATSIKLSTLDLKGTQITLDNLIARNLDAVSFLSVDACSYTNESAISLARLIDRLPALEGVEFGADSNYKNIADSGRANILYALAKCRKLKNIQGVEYIAEEENLQKLMQRLIGGNKDMAILEHGIDSYKQMPEEHPVRKGGVAEYEKLIKYIEEDRANIIAFLETLKKVTEGDEDSLAKLHQSNPSLQERKAKARAAAKKRRKLPGKTGK